MRHLLTLEKKGDVEKNGGGRSQERRREITW